MYTLREYSPGGVQWQWQLVVAANVKGTEVSDLQPVVEWC